MLLLPGGGNVLYEYLVVKSTFDYLMVVKTHSDPSKIGLDGFPSD